MGNNIFPITIWKHSNLQKIVYGVPQGSIKPGNVLDSMWTIYAMPQIKLSQYSLRNDNFYIQVKP